MHGGCAAPRGRPAHCFPYMLDCTEYACIYAHGGWFVQVDLGSKSDSSTTRPLCLVTDKSH